MTPKVALKYIDNQVSRLIPWMIKYYMWSGDTIQQALQTDD